MRIDRQSIVVGALLVAGCGVASCDGCGGPSPGPASSAPSAAAPSSAPGGDLEAAPGPSAGDAPSTRARDESIKTIYPTTGVTPEPLAERLCAIMHEMPADAKSRCCASPRAASLVVGECVRILSFSLQQKALEVDEARLSACDGAMKEALADCDVASSKVPSPEACSELVRGLAAPGASCRSSLECPAAQRCHGVSPTRMGVCGVPRAPAILCETGRDPLAGLVRQDLGRSHPECQGHCKANRCAAAVPEGGACGADQECASGACSDGVCMRTPHPPLGEACRGGRCAVGARCSPEGRCEPRLADGETCRRADDCKSSRCDRATAATSGVCKRACAAVPAVRPPAPSVPATPSPGPKVP